MDEEIKEKEKRRTLSAVLAQVMRDGQRVEGIPVITMNSLAGKEERGREQTLRSCSAPMESGKSIMMSNISEVLTIENR
jgi:hypothetical protein